MAKDREIVPYFEPTNNKPKGEVAVSQSFAGFDNKTRKSTIPKDYQTFSKIDDLSYRALCGRGTAEEFKFLTETEGDWLRAGDNRVSVNNIHAEANAAGKYNEHGRSAEEIRDNKKNRKNGQRGPDIPDERVHNKPRRPSPR